MTDFTCSSYSSPTGQGWAEHSFHCLPSLPGRRENCLHHLMLCHHSPHAARVAVSLGPPALLLSLMLITPTSNIFIGSILSLPLHRAQHVVDAQLMPVK